MNDKTARNLWIGATAIVVAPIIAAFVSGAGTSINFSKPSVALANLFLSVSSARHILCLLLVFGQEKGFIG